MTDPQPLIRVRDVMRTDFGTIDGVATVTEAMRKMKTLQRAVLVVNKRHADDEYGLITVADITRQVLARDRAPDRVNVYEIMTKPVISVHADMDIRYCARLFATCDLVRAPVLDGKTILGMVSINTLVLDGLYRTV